MWNKIVTLGDLREKYKDRVQEVPRKAIDNINDMVVMESTVHAAITQVLESFDFSAADFMHEKNYTDPSILELAGRAFVQWSPQNLETTVKHLLFYGFVVFYCPVMPVGAGENKTNVAIVQDPTMYVPYVCRGDDGLARVVSIPSDEAGHAHPLQTFTWRCPNSSNGALQSPCAALMEEWIALRRTQECRTQAMVRNANPIPIWSIVENKTGGDLASTTYVQEMSTRAIITGEPDDESERMVDDESRKAAAIHQEVTRAMQTYVASLAALERQVNDPAWLAPRGAQATRFATVGVTMPRGVAFAGVMPPSVAPADFGAELQNFRIAVAAALGVPLGVLGLSATTRAAATVSENEAKWFITRVSGYKRMLEQCASDMQSLALGQQCFVQVPVRVPIPLDTLLGMFETLIIDRKTMRDEAVRSYAIGSTDFSSVMARHMNAASVVRSAYGARASRLPEAADTTYTKRPRNKPVKKEDEMESGEEQDETDEQASRKRVAGVVERMRLRG